MWGSCDHFWPERCESVELGEAGRSSWEGPVWVTDRPSHRAVSVCSKRCVCVRDPGDAGPLPTQPHPGPLGSRAEKRAVPPVWKKPQNHSSFALGKQGPRFQKIMRNETTSWGPPSGPTGEGRCVGCTGPSQPGQPLLRREDAPQPFSPVHKAVTAPHP